MKVAVFQKLYLQTRTDPKHRLLEAWTEPRFRVLIQVSKPKPIWMSDLLCSVRG
jgi:hypothetical protein